MYFPAAHSSQNVDPASEAPVVQFRHAACLGLSENQFAGHALQSSASVLPEVLEYLPGAQSLHPETLDTPVAEEKVPAEQFRHAAVMLRRRPVAFRPYFPGGHGVQDAAPGGENVPSARFGSLQCT